MGAIGQALMTNFTPVTRRVHRRSMPSWLGAILGVSLEAKVLGANLTIVGIAIAALLLPLNSTPARLPDLAIILGALAAGVLVNYVLVRLALKPVQDLEKIARRVSEGKVRERVPLSLIADPDLAHLATTMNEMLDNLAAGRERMRKLGAEVVYAQEKERAQIARDLHDSVAQTLAAAGFQIAAAANQVGLNAGSVPLASARELLRGALEEIRTLSRSLHPRVADDLGLPAALESLADATRQRSLIDVRVSCNIGGVSLMGAVSTTLYRIAQETLRIVERDADAGSATIVLTARPDGIVELEIADDGSGLDEPIETVRANPVLCRMRERLSLAGGDLHIDSGAGGRGTRVVATVRVEEESAWATMA
jgi:signal transduction histidine kinase